MQKSKKGWKKAKRSANRR